MIAQRKLGAPAVKARGPETMLEAVGALTCPMVAALAVTSALSFFTERSALPGRICF